MLKLSHISKTFNPGTVNEKVAIRDLSLHLEKGDFATIIGSNGAGKSTMFNAICGDFLTDSGSIVLDGEDITLLQVREAGFPVFPKVINSVFVNSLHFWILALKTA